MVRYPRLITLSVFATAVFAGGTASAAALTGEQVVAQQCGTCHTAGIAGAPKIGDKAAWATRLKTAGSVDALVASAIKGKNAMPPRGGNPARTDAEMKAAVEFMLK